MKPTPHFRNDTAEGLPAKVKAYLDAHYVPTLANWQVAHPKLLVVFSGGNALGKSTIARKLEQELQALVLENDEVKHWLIKLDPGLDRDQRNVLTWQYTMDFYARLSQLTPNGLVVRDGIIDWYYDRILPVFEKQGYPLFVIAFDVSREKRIELIKQRGDKPTVSAQRLISLLEEHDKLAPRFRRQYRPDITLTDANLFSHDRVVAAVRARLEELTA